MVLSSGRDKWLSRFTLSGKICSHFRRWISREISREIFHRISKEIHIINSILTKNPLKFQGALFESPHEDENDVQTISHKCKVLPLNAYTNKYGPDPKKYSSVYDNNDTFYLAGYYDPTVLQLKMEKDIPTATGAKIDDASNES